MFKLQSVGHNALKRSCLWEDNWIKWTASLQAVVFFDFSKMFQFVCFTWFEIFYLDTTRYLGELLCFLHLDFCQFSFPQTQYKFSYAFS